MWRFAVALVAVLLFTSILLGLMIDQVYTSDTDETQLAANDEIELVIPLLRAMAASEKIDLEGFPQLNTRNASIVVRQQDTYPLPAQLNQQLLQGEIIYLETQEQVMAHLLTRNDAILVYQYDKHRLADNQSLGLTLSFYGLLIIVMMVFLAPFINRLVKLRQAAHRFGEGQLDTRLKVGTLWYLRDIELSFNQMADKINVLMDDVKLLAGGLSHELRTPLARVRMGLDTLVETDDEKLRTKYEVRINNQLDEMERLLLHMLDFARLQHSLDEARPVTVDGQKMLNNDVISKFDDALEVQLPNTAFYIKAEQTYLSMALSNIVENAVKYGHARCLLKVVLDKERVIITVSDDGNGINAQQREAIFKPFVRLNHGPERGFGIGLAFSAKIVQRYLGSITVDSCPQLGGARFTLCFSRVNV
ncbi:ATP-binding protein [Pseudoalteromonas luteoviolacea]|uniref:histidine kinase n=1 Tax=Pseudoalteromonas luteoviolacea S4060-1 TaxID=1365257 RepID=A0A167P7U5_9GAMM|nr:ATP-binding protein [Pseudoalteromonas luteoviolacea]KZN69661.1 hypothetical protein N478_10975 [Pseudoalteromonas luteoviolacea S4060-1]